MGWCSLGASLLSLEPIFFLDNLQAKVIAPLYAPLKSLCVFSRLHSDGAKGYFVPGYNVSGFDPEGRPWWWQRYVPCDVEGWCNATNGFDCSQVREN